MALVERSLAWEVMIVLVKQSQISIVPVIFQASRNGDLMLVTCLSSGHSVSILLKKSSCT